MKKEQERKEERSELPETLDDNGLNLNKMHDEIVELIEKDDEVVAQVSDHFNFERRIKKATAYLKNILAKISKESDEILDASSTVTATTVSSKASAKLAKLSIKPFDGNPLKWKTFHDSFFEMIDKSEISEVENFSYLKSYLSGSAEETLSGLSLTSENYNVAMDMLNTRFGDDQVLISAHMNALLKIDVIKSVKETKSLRKIFDSIEAQIRSLENLGIKSDQYGPMLIPILTSKFPDELNLLLSRKMGRGIWDINDVLKYVATEIEARERLNPNPNPTANVPFTTDAFLVDSSKQKSQNFTKKPTCAFCESDKHLAQNCDTIVDIKTRKAIVMNKGRCLKCLRSGHFSRKCQSKIICYNCKSNHHAALCESKKIQKETNSNFVSGSAETIELLQTAQANICDVQENKQANMRIFFDLGSQLSYITAEARNRLQLSTLAKQKFVVKTFGKHETEKYLDKVQFCVKGRNDTSVYVNALVTDICSPLSDQLIDLTQQRYPHLQALDLADTNFDGQDLSVDILIGANHYWSFVSGKVIRPANDVGPVAMESILGYILSGESEVPSPPYSSHATVVETSVLKVASELSDKQNLHNTLHNFWEDPKDSSDDQIVQNFKDNLEFIDNRYQVKLPFKDEFDVINDNLDSAAKRLKGLYKTFKSDQNLYEQYSDVIDYQLKTGIVELVDENEPTIAGHVHYLPHRAVVRDDKASTKVRVVFDASSSSKFGFPPGFLNSFLYAGPSLTSSLFGVLLRFRLYNYAFVADIEKAFLQILLHPSDRNFVRFLWFKNFDPSIKFEHLDLVTLRICRVLFGCTLSPFLLEATLQEHIKKYDFDPGFVFKLLDSLHVNDLISGADSAQDVEDFYLKCVSRLDEASFNLRKFHCNDMLLQKNILIKTGDNIDAMNSNSIKVLGITWNS